MSQAIATFGAGCFWGVEAAFRQTPGVTATAVGYAGGKLDNPTYQDVCTDRTGHAEVVQVDYDPAQVSYDALLNVFWSEHDPTTMNRQGPDVGSQYRSVIYTTTPEHQAKAEASRDRYQQAMTAKGYGEITTAIQPLGDHWYAEDYHQQYLNKNPFGYCPIHATGVKYADA